MRFHLRTRVGRLVALGVLAVGVGSGRADPPKTTTPEQARKAVERGLDFLQKDAVKWRQDHQCSTCHHGIMTVWALSEAKSQGHDVAAETLTETVKWTKDRLLERIDLPRDTRPGWSMVNTPALYLSDGPERAAAGGRLHGRAEANRRASPATPGGRRLVDVVGGAGQEPPTAGLRVGRGRDAAGLLGPRSAGARRPAGKVRSPRRPKEGSGLAGEDGADRYNTGGGAVAARQGPGGRARADAATGD